LSEFTPAASRGGRRQLRRNLLFIKRVTLVAAMLASLVVAAIATTAAGAKKHAAIKVVLVTGVGGLNDKRFNALAYRGLQRAEAELGATIEVKESKSDADYIPNLRAAATGGPDLVIAVGFLMTEAVGKAAAAFPNTKFAIVGVSATDAKIAGAKNVEGLLFREQEAGYLAGYLAGAMQKTRVKGINKKNVVSWVGGRKSRAVDRYGAGYTAGAKAASPGIKVLHSYSNDFVAQDKCKHLANAQIAKGSDVVFPVAGACGLGALHAAKSKKVFGIGLDAAQGGAGPQVITSAVKKVDQAVFLTIQDVSYGRYAGGTNRIFSLKDGGVGLGRLSKKVPSSIKAKLVKVTARIKAGKIKIPATVK
jgi:basic membrane protein A and related proteins